MIHDMGRTRNSLPCRFGLATLLSAGFSATAWGQTDELATAIQEKLDSVGIMGFAASVMVDQEVVWQRGFGYSDWRRTQPFTVDTMTGVASVSKPFIGVAMMQAVEAGKLDLDADINLYLPFKVVNPHHPAQKITLRHLATHTSGISDRWEVYRKSYIFDGDPKQSLEEYLREYLVPGSKEYSTENFLEAKPGAS
ncbi:MAG TPA: serine hydrolase, partial [Armatimonadetes bacterium]|nr:serine hydrolase [Armatimonadota bacterium]